MKRIQITFDSNASDTFVKTMVQSARMGFDGIGTLKSYDVSKKQIILEVDDWLDESELTIIDHVSHIKII